LIVVLERGVVSLVLKPKGNVRVTGTSERASRSGRVRFGGAWPVVQLWELDAERLLTDPDVGVVPWAPLAHTALPPEELVGRCVQRIEAVPNETDRAGLLAVTEILAGFAFPGVNLLRLFEGKPMILREALMSETFRSRREEWQREAAANGFRDAVRRKLTQRFGQLPSEIDATLTAITAPDKLEQLFAVAVTCPDLAAFAAELNKPAA
jgi:hypothetical protein